MFKYKFTQLKSERKSDKEILLSFISDDKKSIRLPFPLGTVYYQIVTGCNNQCYRMKIKPQPDYEEYFYCSHEAPCHTRLYPIEEKVFELSDVKWVLLEFGKTVFLTYDEANEVATVMMEERNAMLQKFTFSDSYL